MPAGRHIAFRGVSFVHVDDAIEEVGFAVLAAEVLLGVSLAEDRGHEQARR